VPLSSGLPLLINTGIRESIPKPLVISISSPIWIGGLPSFITQGVRRTPNSFLDSLSYSSSFSSSFNPCSRFCLPRHSKATKCSRLNRNNERPTPDPSHPSRSLLQYLISTISLGVQDNLYSFVSHESSIALCLTVIPPLLSGLLLVRLCLLSRPLSARVIDS